TPTEKMSGHILEEALRASDTLVHDGASAGPLSQSAAALGVKSFLAMPIKAAGRVIGFGYLDRLRDVALPFAAEQRSTVKSFLEDMAHLVVAVEAHRSVEEEAQRLRETVEQTRLF